MSRSTTGNHLHSRMHCGQSRARALQQQWLRLHSSFQLQRLALRHCSRSFLPRASTAFWCAGNHGPNTALAPFRPFSLEWAVTAVGFKQTKNRLAKQGSSDVLDPPPATACPPCLAHHPAHKTTTPPFTSFILFCTDLIPQS